MACYILSLDQLYTIFIVFFNLLFNVIGFLHSINTRPFIVSIVSRIEVSIFLFGHCNERTTD